MKTLLRRLAVLPFAVMAVAVAVTTFPAGAVLARSERADQVAGYHFIQSSPSNEDIGRAVLKSLGAVALHEAAKPQQGDGAADAILRAIARQARDELIDSALRDLFKTQPAVERASIRNLVVLILDGRQARDRNQIQQQLRGINPNMADAVEVAEFLIRLGQAVDRK